MGDLLLVYCLDNVRNHLGRTRQVQRVAPAHYMSSWVDLPESVSHLRKVPEMMVAMLADQKRVDHVVRSVEGERTRFPVGGDIHRNVLLQPFVSGVTPKGGIEEDYARDQFDDESRVGIDQLLMIRLATRLGQAPGKVKGSPQIPNQRPIARRAAQLFAEDLRKYVRSYANQVPRQAFVELLESCLAIGLTTTVASVVEIVLKWEDAGDIPQPPDQHPPALFVDCSMGLHRPLRRLAEQSMDEFMRRARRFPVVLMALRLLDYKVRYDRKIQKEAASNAVAKCPYADTWLQLLGNVLNRRHPRSDPILDSMDEMAEVLAEKVESDHPEVADLLRRDTTVPNPIWRLAEGLTVLQAGKAQSHLENLIDSALFVDRPNGLATKRRARRKAGGSGAPKTTILRALAFTDPVLEYLVHRLLLKSGGKSGTRQFSFNDFVDELRERYGFCIDRSPPGLTASNDLLQQNRAYLDRRLRDMGLLASVNDAEAMKRLTPRFKPAAGKDG